MLENVRLEILQNGLDIAPYLITVLGSINIFIDFRGKIKEKVPLYSLIKERDGWECQLAALGIEHGCTGTEEDLTIHHIDPKANGGSEHPFNLITICDAGQNWLHNGKANSPKVLSFMAQFKQIARINTQSAVDSGNNIAAHLKRYL